MWYAPSRSARFTNTHWMDLLWTPGKGWIVSAGWIRMAYTVQEPRIGASEFMADLLWTFLDCGIEDWEQSPPEFKYLGGPSWQLSYRDPGEPLWGEGQRLNQDLSILQLVSRAAKIPDNVKKKKKKVKPDPMSSIWGVGYPCEVEWLKLLNKYRAISAEPAMI